MLLNRVMALFFNSVFSTCALSINLLASQAYAQDAMQINVVAFAQPEQNVTFELWRPADEVKREFPASVVDFNNLQSSVDSRYTHLGSLLTTRLTRATQKLQSSDYRILTQQSWMQPLSPPDQASGVVLRGGQVLGDHYELEGYVTIFQSNQKVRMSTHLWLCQTPHEVAPSHPATNLPPTASPGVQSVAAQPACNQVAALNDLRILNEGDLHYIDHPRFGLLVELGSGVAESTTDSAESSSDASESNSDTTGTATGNDADASTLQQ